MDFAIYVLLAGIGTTLAGLALHMAAHFLYSRYKRGDTKEIAGVVGFRVSAIWGIAVGLIFAASAEHLIESKGNLLEEARLISTLQFLAAEATEVPSLPNKVKVQKQLRNFAERSVNEVDSPAGADSPSRATDDLLLRICREMAPEKEDSADLRWTKEEFQRTCGKLIDLRGKKRVGRGRGLSPPRFGSSSQSLRRFWPFYSVSSNRDSSISFSPASSISPRASPA